MHVDHSGLTWRKSTYSDDGGNADCVEVACLPLAAAVRDSKNPAAGMLAFPDGAWRSFLGGLSG
ncbi:DUF397 domain-containing protein [Kibdelosporangium banguiense]|uniref:DUF397 domain-containing protein n=1 Tax=Kibdelosporangium banguiense TaxID=1365924 RepID=UPI001AE62395|nr:DUF397 domain-containing protein [Kibdelosporangium banguiense]